MRLLVPTLFALVSSAGAAFAVDVHPAVERAARTIERSCDMGKSAAKNRLTDWHQTLARDARGEVVLVAGKKTGCAPVSQRICGTGGCPVTVLRITPKASRIFYNRQVLDWRLEDSARGKALRLMVHGSRCGLPGNAECVSVIDLASGKAVSRAERF